MRYDITWRDIDRQRKWSDQTFGPGTRTEGVLRHIEKEIEEVRRSGGADLKEWLDIIILAIDGATRAGALGEDLIDGYHEKMRENFERAWPDWRDFSEDEPIEHIRRQIAATMPDEFPEAFAEVLAEGYVQEYRRMAGGAIIAPEEDPGE